MRVYLATFLLCSGFLFPAAASENDPWYTEGGDYKPSTRIEVVLTNTLTIERKDCPVTIYRKDLPFSNFGPRELIVVDPSLPSRPEPTKEYLMKYGGHTPRGEQNGAYIHYQCDDLDRDGVWDELFFMTDLKPRETKTIYLYIGFNNRGLYPHSTFAAVGDYSRHPVCFWESEYLTWKLFYPTDIDIQAKRVPMFEGYYTMVNNMSGYDLPDFDQGGDIMTVGVTFGAGGIGLFENPAKPDSISRPRFSPFRKLGLLEDTRYVFEVVASGPVRSIVRCRTLNWRSGQGEYELEQYYTAYKNKYYSTCEVKYTKWFPRSAETLFGCGIRKIMFESENYVKGGIVISTAFNMPVIDPNPETIKREKMTLDYASTALVVKDKYKPQYMFVPQYDGNHTFRIPLTQDLSYEYLIAACWAEAPNHKTAPEFKEYVLTTALEYNNPPIVKSLKLELKKEGYKPIEYWVPPTER